MLLPILSPDAKLKKEIYENTKKTIHYLSVAVGERSLRKYENLKQSATYIRNEFSKSAFPIMEEEYYVDNKKVSNIIAEIPGYERPEKIILIGAHYDTVENTPGADDNASGIASLLELYRLFSPTRCRRTLRFVAFTLEEPPYFNSDKMGSMVYAKRARDRNEPIELMICLEMMGFAGKQYKQKLLNQSFGKKIPDRGDFLAVVSLPSSAEYIYSWKKTYSKYSKQGIIDIVGPSSIQGIALSDHYSFHQYGFPAIMLTDTAFYRNENYHLETDTFDTINFKFLADHISSTFNTIKDIANSDSITHMNR